MKCGLVLLFLFGWTLSLSAQCPPEWLKYTYGGYLYDIQSDYNHRGLSETSFKNGLLNAARTNLAKKVQVQVKDDAQLNKQAVDGRSWITYSSSTRFSTDVNLKLVDSRTLYNPDTKGGFAIVFIDKAAACVFYRNELAQVLGRVDNALMIANNYVVGGFKDRAHSELKVVLPEFDKLEEPFFWLNFFGMSQGELADWTGRFNGRQQTVKQMLAELMHGTYVYLNCTADLFGRPYPTLQNELKGKLAAEKYSFTADLAEADWIIEINVAVREGNIAVVGGMTSYFAYADAQVTIDKTATSQRIYADEVSVKGGHTRNYTEAGRAAYKDLSRKLDGILKQNIRE